MSRRRFELWQRTLYLGGGIRVRGTASSGIGPASVGAPRSVNYETKELLTIIIVFDQVTNRAAGCVKAKKTCAQQYNEGTRHFFAHFVRKGVRLYLAVPTPEF